MKARIPLSSLPIPSQKKQWSRFFIQLIQAVIRGITGHKWFLRCLNTYWVFTQIPVARVKDFKCKDVTTDLEVFWTQIPAPDEVSSQVLFKETAFYWRSGVFSWLRFGGTFSEQGSVRIFAFGWQPIEPGFLPRKNEVALLAFPWSSTCLQT